MRHVLAQIVIKILLLTGRPHVDGFGLVPVGQDGLLWVLPLTVAARDSRLEKLSILLLILVVIENLLNVVRQKVPRSSLN